MGDGDDREHALLVVGACPHCVCCRVVESDVAGGRLKTKRSTPSARYFSWMKSMRADTDQ